MTELQNIALVYESSVLMVEDAQSRIKFLLDKYSKAWAKAIADYEMTPADTTNWNRKQDPDWQSSFKEYLGRAHEQFSLIVNHLDPTHGKYSEWFIRQMIQSMTIDKWDRDWFLDTFNMKPEDRYKVAEVIQTYDQIKHRLLPIQRDINRLSADDVINITKPHIEDQAELTKKELERKIKSEETIKLVDALNGWTVVVPLSRLSAGYYGAHTQWCTAAKVDEHNRFADYTKRGPLVIFIGPEQKKYQWWYNFANFGVEPEGKYVSERYWASNIEDAIKDEAFMFMDVQDHPVPRSVIPDEVWDATMDAMVAKSGAKPTKEFLNGDIPFVQDDTPLDNFNNRMLYGAPVMLHYPDYEWNGVTETQREPEEEDVSDDERTWRNMYDDDGFLRRGAGV